ncbi:MAG: acylphosphatase [bacterium]
MKLNVQGRVQGVGFRWFVVRQAEHLHLQGYVKNMFDGSVEVVAEGEEDGIEKLIAIIKKGPTFSRVEHVQESRGDFTGHFTSFKVEF